MADRKITDLTALAAGSQATGDLLTIVDVSETAATDKNKKMTMENLFKGIPGDVGIGTSSPGASLEISNSTSNAAKLRVKRSNSHSNHIELGTNGGESQIVANGVTGVNGSLIFARDSDTGTPTESARIDSSGNVGIGTASPDALCHINKTSGTTLYRASVAGNSTIGLEIVKTGSTTQSWRIVDGQTVNGKLEFYDVTDTATRMCIDGSGNVGIGTTSPSQILELRAATPRLCLNGSTSNSSKGIEFEHNGTTSGSITHNHATGPLTISSGDNGTGYFINFKTDNSERMRIDSSGNVGIGESSPAAGLDVKVDTNPVLAIDRGSANTANFNLQYNGTLTGQLSAANADFQVSAVGSSTPMSFYANGSERMRIDSSGRVGIGTTSLVSKFTIDNGGRADPSSTGSTTQSNAALEINADTESNTRLMAGMSTGSKFWMQVQNNVGNGTDDILLNPIGGNVGIGTTSPTRRLHVAVGGSDPQLRLQDTSATESIHSAIEFNGDSGRQAFIGKAGSTDLLVINDNSSGALRLYTDANERMRITSGSSNGANILFNCTSTPSSSVKGSAILPNGSNGNYFQSAAATTSAYAHAQFVNTNGVVGDIQTSGSSTAYNTSSDYRLKENVVDLDGAITRVKQLAPKRFNFIADDTKTVDGFLAHEAQTVVPEAVTGSHNEVDGDGNPVYQGIDQSKLIPLLTAALQEAIAEIETLKTKVAALEAG